MTKRTFITIHKAGETAPKKIPLTEEITSVGRSSTNIIKISDSGASRRHCIIARLGANYRLIDLGSKNGTKVNDTIIKEKDLAHGDKIQIGKEQLIFTFEEVEKTDSSAAGVAEKPPEVTPMAPDQAPDAPAESTPQEQPPVPPAVPAPQEQPPKPTPAQDIPSPQPSPPRGEGGKISFPIPQGERERMKDVPAAQEQPSGPASAAQGEVLASKEAEIGKEQPTTFWNIIVTVFRSVLIMVFILVLLTALFDLAIKQQWIKVRPDVNLLTVWRWGFYGIFAAIGLQFIWIMICMLFFKSRWKKYQTRYARSKEK